MGLYKPNEFASHYLSIYLTLFLGIGNCTDNSKAASCQCFPTGKKTHNKGHFQTINSSNLFKITLFGLIDGGLHMCPVY